MEKFSVSGRVDNITSLYSLAHMNCWTRLDWTGLDWTTRLSFDLKVLHYPARSIYKELRVMATQSRHKFNLLLSANPQEFKLTLNGPITVSD